MSKKEEAISRFKRIMQDLVERKGGQISAVETIEDDCDLVYVHAETGLEVKVKFDFPVPEIK